MTESSGAPCKHGVPRLGMRGGWRPEHRCGQGSGAELRSQRDRTPARIRTLTAAPFAYGEPTTCFRMTTRRFSARPAAVLFEATGLVFPLLDTVSRLASIPARAR